MANFFSGIEMRFYGLSMIFASLLFSISGFFWNGAEYGVAGGTLLNLSFIFWIPAFIGLFGLLKEKMPGYASWGLLVAFVGCISGANFGMAGVQSTVFGISHEAYLAGYAKYPVSSNLLLFATGPVFPLSLLILSVQLLRKGLIPKWAAILLGLASLLFPPSRIYRFSTLAHLVDLMILIPLIHTGVVFLLNAEDRQVRKSGR